MSINFWPKPKMVFTDIFRIGKKKIPIALKKNTNGYVVKLGSGFASYTLETTKEELTNLSNFVNNFLVSNP